jgi:acylphosphatase
VAPFEGEVKAARHLIVHGRVQGVGYRDAAVQAAFTLNVTGWVRNRNDGTVEAHVQGEADAVDRFVEWCRRGPPLARVASLDASDAAFDATLGDFAWRATV